MLELVELGPRARDRPAELSGGQRQRVALARALINRPKVLLLDEPLAALDRKLRHAMQAELKSIQREVGITFLFVTHDQDEALSMSDRVAIMNGGVIEQCGTPEDVYENPTSVFAAEFIGTSNLMSGTYDGGIVAVTPALQVPVPGHAGSADGDRVSVAIRPEKIWMSDLTPAMVQTPGTIVSTSYHGATTQYVISVGPGLTLTVLEQNLPRMRADERWAPGDRVQVGWLPEHAVVLR
jgi:spermidine/putrescine transport system ATP-binding protein